RRGGPSGSWLQVGAAGAGAGPRAAATGVQRRRRGRSRSRQGLHRRCEGRESGHERRGIVEEGSAAAGGEACPGCDGLVRRAKNSGGGFLPSFSNLELRSSSLVGVFVTALLVFAGAYAQPSRDRKSTRLNSSH